MITTDAPLVLDQPRDYGIPKVCDACRDESDCDSGEECTSNCGPGCEDDEGGCCAVFSCTVNSKSCMSL